MDSAAIVMIVDDVSHNRLLLGEMLKDRGYDIRAFPSGELALNSALQDPPDLILLDINMPEMDGYEVCRHLKKSERLKDIPVLFISALTETEDKVKAFNTGGQDYVTKPFQIEEVDSRVKTHLRLRELQIELEKLNLNLQHLVAEQVKEISDSQIATITALAKLAESRDDETGKHIERVQQFCKILAVKLSESDRYKDRISETYIESIYHASPLHDIGKVGVRDHILLKPGKLTVEEFEGIKKHSIIGAQTLRAVKKKYPKNALVNMGIAIARHHQEKWDGSGYPDGLVGEDIPLAARIMAVADVYDALRSKRIYKEAFSHKKSVKIILDGSGKHFDPDVVNAFAELESEFDDIRTKME